MKLLIFLPWLGLLRAQQGTDVDVNVNSAVATSDSDEIDPSVESPAVISSSADATVAIQPDISVLPVSSTSQLDASSEPTQLGAQPASETIGILLARLVQVAEESGNDALVAAGIPASMMASTNVYPGSSRDLALQNLESLQSSVQSVAATAVGEPLSSLQAAGSTISIAISSVNGMALAVAPTQTSSDNQSTTNIDVGAKQTSSDSQSLTGIADGLTSTSSSASPKTFQSLDMSAVPPAPTSTSTATEVLPSSTSINDSVTPDPTATDSTATDSSAMTGTVDVSTAPSTPTDSTIYTSEATSTSDSITPAATQGISLPANGTVNTLPTYSPGPDASSALKLSLSLSLCVLAYFVIWI